MTIKPIYEDTTLIGFVIDDRLSICIYGYRYYHNFTLISNRFSDRTSNDNKLYYKFKIDNISEYILLESEYNTPSCEDQKSILELSLILRYKYHKVLDTIFDNRLLSAKYYNIDHKWVNYMNGIIHIMGIDVGVDESIVKSNTLLSKLFYEILRGYSEPYVDGVSCEIIASNIIHTFITVKPNYKKAINFDLPKIN